MMYESEVNACSCSLFLPSRGGKFRRNIGRSARFSSSRLWQMMMSMMFDDCVVDDAAVASMDCILANVLTNAARRHRS